MSFGEIGHRLFLARRHAGLTHRALAERADVATATLSELESQARNEPGTDLIARLARALNVSACWLAYGDEDKEPDWLDDPVED